MKMKRWLPVGGKRPLTLPVQANGIASYFPTLPTKSEALRQFSAPRPSATPSQRHSSAARPGSTVDSDADELQLSSSSELLTPEVLLPQTSSPSPPPPHFPPSLRGSVLPTVYRQ